MKISTELEAKLFTNPVLVIAHAPCIDGFCAAFVFKTYLTWLEQRENRPIDVTFVCGNHANKLEKLPDVRGKVVFILDFSYPRKTLLALQQKAEELVVLDHHVSAQKDLQGLPGCIFDMGRSGAQLTADFVGAAEYQSALGMPSLSTLVAYVSDRDLWKFILPESQLINTAIGSWPYRFESAAQLSSSYDVWKTYAQKSVADFLQSAIYEGAVIKRQLDKMVDDAISFTRLGQLLGQGTIVPTVNVYPHIVSETLSRLLETYDYPYVIGWYFDGNKYVYSLRSDGDYDVSELAKRYGGGGHAKSAGFASRDFFIDSLVLSAAHDIKIKQALGLLY